MPQIAAFATKDVLHGGWFGALDAFAKAAKPALSDGYQLAHERIGGPFKRCASVLTYTCMHSRISARKASYKPSHHSA